MILVFRMAWRNIFRHKSKTAVIGIILFLGAFVLTLGSGVIEGLNAGLQRNIVNGFTGDVVIMSKAQQAETVLASMSGKTIEPILNYPKIKPILENAPFVQAILPAGVGYVWVLNDTGQPVDQYILGVNFGEYKAFFKQNIAIEEGRYPDDNARGLLVSTYYRDYLYGFTGDWAVPAGCQLNKDTLSEDAKADGSLLKIKHDIVFLGLSEKNSSLDILSPVTGIFKFHALNKMLGWYSLVDIESFRECLGYFSSDATKVSLSSDQATLLGTENPEDMFELSMDTVEKGASTAQVLATLQGPRQEMTTTLPANWEEGAFTVIFVRLKEGMSPQQGIKQLTALFEKEHLPLKAVKWSKAIGMMGQFAVIMKGALYVFVGFIFFVAIIIIMNTLSMTTMERVTEIGMMRAVGAKKRMISGMLVIETFLLSLFFGSLGMLGGGITVKVLSSMNIETQNEMIQILYGGYSFHPILTPLHFGVCFVLLIIVTLLAVMYPIFLSRSITPLDAMTRE